MLPKKYRLTVSRFNQIPQKSIEFGHISFTIKVKKNSATTSRFAFIVPKFLDKRSTVRHLTKRIAEELIREKIKNIKNPMNILIKFKKIITKNDCPQLKEDLDFIFLKINSLWIK